MRLVRLNLARYGKFTDFVLNFGEKQAGKPDFHVIYGPNEAGKTTTLAGFLDLVYGFPKGSKYDFKHTDATAVGGLVEFSGGATREFVRIKKQVNSLLDAAGHVVPDAAILGDLESLARADYMMKFSLNAETLENGGVDILKSKGDLGQLLFSAGAGVTDLSEKLIKLNGECEDIYKKRGQKTEIARLKALLEELATEKAGLDMAWKSYSKISSARNELAKRYEDARRERNAAQIEFSKFERLETTIPRFSTLKAIAEELESLADAPEELPGLKQKVKDLNEEDLKLDGEMKAEAAAIALLEGELAEIHVDEVAVGLSDRLKSIDVMRVRFKAADDLWKRENTANEIAGDIAVLLSEIGRKGDLDPASLLLDVSITAPLRDLSASHSGFETALRTARDEVEQAKDRLKEESEKLTSAKGKAGVADPDALELLGTIVGDIRKNGFDGAVRTAVKAVDDLRQDLTDAMKPLAPWRGDSDDLGALKIPGEGVVALWSAELDAFDDAFKSARSEKLRIERELSSSRAKRDATAVGTGVVSDGEAAQRRSDREVAWALHRRTLVGDTADAFEERLRADDVAVSLRFSHAGEVAKINATLEAVALNEKRLEQAAIDLDEAGRACENARDRIAAAIGAVSADLPASMSPEDFAVWSKAIDHAVEVRADLLEVESNLRQANRDRDSARVRLCKSMAKAGVTHVADEDLEDLLLVAEKANADVANIKNLVANETKARKELTKREAALVKAQNDINGWNERWAEVTGSCWIGSTHAEPSTTLVGEILLKLGDLRAKLKEHGEMLQRIESMKADKELFAEQIQALADKMGEAIDGRAIKVIDECLAERAKAADSQHLKRSGKQDDLRNARLRQSALASKISQLQGPKQEIFDQLGVSTLAEAETALDRAKDKAGLLKRKIEEEGLILKALGKSSMAEAEAALNEIDLAGLVDEKTAVEDKLNGATAKQQELFAEKSKLDDQLDGLGGDEAVALLEEKRRAVLLEIEDTARRWFRLRAGIVATEFALRNYRDKHRSSMLAKTSVAFATITRGAYIGLKPEPDGAGEILLCTPSDGGGARKANELSKGTQFQLYFALRIAGYHEYANFRDPPSGVPFVADDILEPFDDDRSEEAFGLLAKMAEVGQVIYLTHHQHLCAIAQKVCPDVRLHRLP